MKNLLVVPLLAALLAVAAKEADAGYCGAVSFRRCAACCGCDYCGARQQCCAASKLCRLPSDGCCPVHADGRYWLARALSALSAARPPLICAATPIASRAIPVIASDCHHRNQV